MLNPIR